MKKILIVEDDKFLADIYKTKLEGEGFEVKTAKDGKEALKKLEKYIPDLLLLDIILPKIDGWEILERIKEREDLKNMKIIVLSNLSEKENIEKAIREGVVEYLVKAEYSPDEIVEKIKEL